jgi:aerobic-type carbon monoxide dehydrogenase small subunit (CoxS/CutS family)
MLHIRFKLNGKKVEAEVREGTRAIDLLRNTFGLTGTKESCGQGECGSCTILLDEEAVHSCLLLAAQMDGCRVVTIEGLEKDGELDVLQQAFLDAGAIQCGYCTPGMIMAAKGLLLHNPTPTTDEIKEAMSGNLCRCTGYKKIREAVELAAERQKG